MHRYSGLRRYLRDGVIAGGEGAGSGAGNRGGMTSRSKDRSLRQLLQGERIPNVGAAEGCDLLLFRQKPAMAEN
jgi:hypothetical protein